MGPFKNTQGFVVVYSWTNHQTFQDIKTMREHIVRVKELGRVPILLVGNRPGVTEGSAYSGRDGPSTDLGLSICGGFGEEQNECE